MDELTGTVLIVDDEEPFSRFLAWLLDRQGFHTDCVHSGAMARRRMGELFPDVVLMDLELPDADGAELMVELSQKHPASSSLLPPTAPSGLRWMVVQGGAWIAASAAHFYIRADLDARKQRADYELSEGGTRMASRSEQILKYSYSTRGTWPGLSTMRNRETCCLAALWE